MAINSLLDIPAAIDRLGHVRASIKDLKTNESTYRDQLAELEAGTYFGHDFDCQVTAGTKLMLPKQDDLRRHRNPLVLVALWILDRYRIETPFVNVTTKARAKKTEEVKVIGAA